MTPLMIREILAIYIALVIVNIILMFILKLTRQLVSRRLKYIKTNILTFKHKPNLLKQFYKSVRQKEPKWAVFIPVGYIFCAMVRIYRLLSLLNKFELMIICLINKSSSCDTILKDLESMDGNSPISDYEFDTYHPIDIANIKKDSLYTEEELEHITVKETKEEGKKDCHLLMAIMLSVARLKGHKDT